VRECSEQQAAGHADQNVKTQTHAADPKPSVNVMRFPGMKAAVAILGIFVGFEASTAALEVEPGLPQQTIDRTLKGDRMAPAFSSHSMRLPEIRTSRTPAINYELADGCESLVSPLANAPLARVARRCVS
jgi:hypothetical protein